MPLKFAGSYLQLKTSPHFSVSNISVYMRTAHGMAFNETGVKQV